MQEIDLRVVTQEKAVVLQPGTVPTDEELPMFVGASIPERFQVAQKNLNELANYYEGDLEIHQAADGRTCIILLCTTARSLTELGEFADELVENLDESLGIRNIPVITKRGYMTCCEVLEAPYCKNQAQ